MMFDEPDRGQRGRRNAGPRILLLIVQVSATVLGQESPVDPFSPARVEEGPFANFKRKQTGQQAGSDSRNQS